MGRLIKYKKQFGLTLTIVKLVLCLQNIKFLIPILQPLNTYKHNLVRKKVEAIIPSTIYDDLENTIGNESKIIWTFWYQGADQAPDIVKKCFDQMKKMFSDYQLVIIDKNTISQYYQFNECIKTKLDNGSITLTHFSDLLRMHLLDTYGGYWIDSTIFVSEVPFTNNTFYTIKNVDKKTMNVSIGRWTAFMLGGNNPKLYHFASLVFQEYWKHYDMLIDYFLVDYVIDIAYRNVVEVKDNVDLVRNTDKNVFEVRDNLNRIVSDEEFEELIYSNQLHKLTYKMKFNDNHQTVYNRLLQMEI